jgi:protein-disulfide isomerase
MKHWRDMAWWAMCPRQRIVGGITLAIALATTIALLLAHQHKPAHAPPSTVTAATWIYGNTRARYTLIEYADLECPYCKAYFPILKAWIDAHPDVNWQWHHRPLAIHEPAATSEARLTECAGRTNGNEGFWRAVTWIYANTRGNGEGLPATAIFPQHSPKLIACLESSEASTAVQAQAGAASRGGIDATPTVKLVDHASGKTILLEGAIDGDALLSAMDWLADSSSANAPSVSTIVHPPKHVDHSSDIR